MKHIVWLLLCLFACDDPSPPGPPPELARWLEDWEAMRTCLVGNRSGVTDLAVALKVTQLRGSRCTPPRSSLVANVEPELVVLWRRAIERVAVVAAAESVVGLEADLDAIDTDVVELRQRAGLEPIERTPATPLVALDSGRALALPGGAVTSDEIRSLAPLTARRKWHEHVYELTLDGDAPVLARGDFNGVIARPSASWSIWSTGAMDHRYRISDRPKAGREIPYYVDPHFALDGRGVRAVALSADDVPFVLAVSTDGGVTWQLVWGHDKTRYVGGSQDPRTGELHVFVRSVDALWMYVITPDSLPEIASRKRLPIRQVDRAMRDGQTEAYLDGSRRIDCRSEHALWVATRDMLLRIDRDDTLGFTIRRRRLADPIASVACKDDVAITLRHEPDVVDRCIAGGCGPVLELAKGVRGAATMLRDGRWMYAAAIDDVVGIWRADARPRFYRLATRGEIVGMPWVAGVPQLAVSTSDGVRLVRIP